MNYFSLLLSAAGSADGFNIDFQPEKFLDMLPYMGKGMLVIFVIIGFIILSTLVINKIFSNKNK